MGKYKPFSRRELASRFKRWAYDRRWLVAGLALGAIVLLAFETLLLVVITEPTALHWYLLGCTHAAVLVALPYMVHVGFLASDREAILHLRGAWGEENTRSELERARKKGLIWGWVDSVQLKMGDIDHLVVTRNGGLVAIDTKWRNQTSVADREDMARAANRVRVRSEGVVHTVLEIERGTHRARTRPIRVRPAVVVWGELQRHVPEGAYVNEIPFVRGRQLVTWLRSLNGETVDESAAKDLLRRIEQYRAGAWSS